MTSSQNGCEFTIENNVLKGKVVPYHEVDTSLGQFILRKLKEDPDFVGQIELITGEKSTYKTMQERSIRCALWLKSQGLRPKDVVAICSKDHPDFAMVCFAILYLGAIVSPWDDEHIKEEYPHRMNIVKPKMAFVSEESAAVIVEAAKTAKLDLKIIVFGHLPGFFEFENVIAEPGIDEVEKFSCVPIESSGEIAVIVFSSGTTGLAKGVALSHKAHTLFSHEAERIGMPGKICLTITPTDWFIHMDSMLTSLLLKTPRLILPKFEESSACAAIEKYKINWVQLYTGVINRLLKFHAVDQYDLSSLKQFLYVGAPLSNESSSALAKLLPGLQITGGYGTTELCAALSIQSRKSPPGSSGKIMENRQLKVIDPDTGRTLGANQRGELLLKSDSMMNGYYDNPQATSEIIDKDGWLHSGDFGYYDEEGEIFVVDRLKDIVRLAEIDVSPTEIEGVIWTHPGVKDVAVVGQPRSDGDDLLIAFVVRAEDSVGTSKQVTEKEIIDLVAAELPETKWLRAGVRFIDQIPKTRSNKEMLKNPRISQMMIAAGRAEIKRLFEPLCGQTSSWNTSITYLRMQVNDLSELK